MLDTSCFSQAVASDALAGLTAARKTLPAKLLYDDEGCRLFGEITRLPEYYVTRTERALLSSIAPLIPLGADAAIVEYGASDEAKASILFEALDVAAYVPIDVASGALHSLQIRMAASHPGLEVFPIEADFLSSVSLPPEINGLPKLGFFPGSTIGNLDLEAAQSFLYRMRRSLRPGALFLIGVDLQKDAAILIPAYDDTQGITAAFNRNLLIRLNREAAAGFDVDSFRHRAIWNASSSRIEMHLESLQPQSVVVAGELIHFQAGETIHTENSYKHSLKGFRDLAVRAGWTPVEAWTDHEGLFSIHLLTS